MKKLLTLFLMLFLQNSVQVFALEPQKTLNLHSCNVYVMSIDSRPKNIEVTNPAVVEVTSTSDSFTQTGQLVFNTLQAMIDADPIDTYNRMRCLETAYKAKLKKLEYQEEAKQLYRVEEIRRDLLEVFTKIRGELLSIPQRVAGRCEGRDTREIEEILDNEINAALEHIQKSKFSEEAKPSRAGRAGNSQAKA